MPLENLGPIGQRSLLVGLAKLNQGYGTSEEGGSLLLKRRSLKKKPGQVHPHHPFRQA
jgi:hypothetical protein